MMLDYYIRANLLTSAVEVATSRLRRPVDRVSMLPGDRCLAQAGLRWLVLDVRPASGGWRDMDGAPPVGGGGWRISGEAADKPTLSGPCRRRADLMRALMSFASGDLKASLDEVAVLGGGGRCRVRAGLRSVGFEAVWRDSEDWWEIARSASDDTFEPLRVRLERWLSRAPRG